MLNTETAAQGTVIGEEKIESLPLNGRQFIDLTLLSPNVTAGGRSVQQNKVRLNQDGGFSASGNRTNNNSFMLDGVSNLDCRLHVAQPDSDPRHLAEFQVQTASSPPNTATPPERRSTWSPNPATTIGTATAGNSSATASSTPASSTFLRDSPQYQRNQFGGTAGGPIRRNKLFVFGGYERLILRQAAGGLTTVTVPTALERQGNFSHPKPPSTMPFTSPRARNSPNDTIPQSRLNPHRPDRHQRGPDGECSRTPPTNTSTAVKC